jgi:predicted phosphatase
MKEMVSEGTVGVLYAVIEDCFEMNRWMDRAVSVLGVKFAMNNTSKLCHLGIAHYFPAFSDKVGELCLERYNITVEYGATPEGKQDYSSPKDIINQMNDKIIGFQEVLMGAVQTAQNNKDCHVYSDLIELLRQYNQIVEQTILLVDKMELYKDDMASFDAHIKDNFWIL